MEKISKYGNAAVYAVKTVNDKSAGDPRDAWEKAMMEFYPTQESSRKKGCPLCAFLGLCESGMIKGIKAGSYGLKAGNVNKGYAVKAAQLLLNGMIADKRTLWSQVIPQEPSINHKKGKVHNSQMDVVMALHQEELLVKSDDN